MEEENKKRKGYEPTGDVAGKRPKMPGNADVIVGDRHQEEEEEEEDDEDDVMGWLTLDEDTAAELSKLLDADMESPPFKVKFIDDSHASPVVFQSSSAYVTINGNEESCGSSFSECESSVMASVDMRGMKREAFGWLGEVNGGAFGLHAEEAREWVEGVLVKEMNGCDSLGCCDHQKAVPHDDDDDTWIKFLGEDTFL